MEFFHLPLNSAWEWFGVQGVLMFLFVFLLMTDLYKSRVPKNFPPGPWPLPFVGNFFNIDSKQPHIYMTKLAEDYGEVYSLRLGWSKTVVVNGYKMVKEALVNQAEAFSERPLTPVFHRLNKGQGLILSSGHMWKRQRRFAFTTLKNFGVGKKTLESTILEEIRHLQETIEEEQGRPYDPHFTFNNAVSNIICSVVLGRRFEYSDVHFQEILHLMFEGLYLQGTIWGQLYDAFPAVMRLIPGRHQTLFSNIGKVADFLREEIRQHRQDWDPSAPRDYIDCYLREMEKSKDDALAGFCEENLCYTTLDLFGAGTETTSTTLRWALLYMIKYPQIQEKVQAEIDSVIGQARQPSMEDKPNMPYTDAVIHEVQRMGNIVPLNLPRKTTKDTTLGRYFIPKGTRVIPNLTSVLFDKNEWQTPDTFNPGHFLDAEGQFVRRDAFLPFSAGKRVCLGEQLARMELFLFLTSFLQKYTFSCPEGVEPSFEIQIGITLSPQDFKICAVHR
ncbi:cytochrome P450 2J2-like isoform X1 [Acipenser ruthenus]|uniref:cytochrome P450 2J2-like isoform X1 n=1 Tax=Acipenser ruthenus TaxID=7906 RepID=UPI00145AF9D0|nr:cytochrome P450 2J2-like isoform X1 [Acipenser ruthenus]